MGINEAVQAEIAEIAVQYQDSQQAILAAALDGRLAQARGFVQAPPEELAAWLVSGYLAIDAAVRGVPVTATAAAKPPAAQVHPPSFVLEDFQPPPAPPASIPASVEGAMDEFRRLVREQVATELRTMYPPAVATPVPMTPFSTSPPPSPLVDVGRLNPIVRAIVATQLRR